MQSKKLKIKIDNYMNNKLMIKGKTLLSIHLNRIKKFEEWLKGGNVHKTKDGYYTTQDSQYTNRIKTKKELYNYYKKEFNN
jgi:PII-like signaling protein|tara:strand:- start:879 stop:1121 length:243 start_codon:yes stop_codon:yes gene_type:complete